MRAIWDRLQNLVSGLGVGKDKAFFDQFAARILSDAELLNMYRADWLARKIVTIPVEDQLREWRGWQATKEQITLIEETEARLKVKQSMSDAMIYDRLYGGGAILISDGTSRPERPLDVEKVRKDGISFMHAMPRGMLPAKSWNEDPTSPGFNQPLTYSLNATSGSEVVVDASRVVRFVTYKQMTPTMQREAWGDSVLLSVYDAIHDAALASSATASMMHEAKNDVVMVPDLSAHLATDEGTSRLLTRFGLADTMKSLYNMLLLGDNETFERKQFNFAGMPDIIRMFLQIVSGAADIPATRLLGQAPAGMNATGESDIRNYYDKIASDQDALTRKITTLDEVIIRSALGSRPSEVWYQWNPLWQLTDTEKADLALKKAQTSQIYVTTMLVPEKVIITGVKNQLIEDGTYPGIEDAYEEFEDELFPPEPDPADPEDPNDPAPDPSSSRSST